MATLPEVLKYPRTAHLIDLGASSVDDLVVVARNQNGNPLSDILCGSGSTTTTTAKDDIIIEEKVDGANMGFRLSSSNDDSQQILVQNRSRYISSGDHAQFSRVDEWVHLHRPALFRILRGSRIGGNKLILYGEWCTAKHSLLYDKLPDYFVAFDLYDTTEQKFYSRRRFHTALQDSGIAVVPTIRQGLYQHSDVQSQATNVISVKKKAKKKSNNNSRGKRDSPNRRHDGDLLTNEIRALLDTPSAFRKDGGPVEGVVLRRDDPEGNWLEWRYKVVRPDFIQGCACAHWTRRPVVKQVVDYDFAETYLRDCYVYAADDEMNKEDKDFHDHTATSANSNEGTGPASAKSANAAFKRAAAAEKKAEQVRKNCRRRIPRCIMLCGLPGNGKSTFANRLQEALARDGRTIEIANQDDLGRKQCEQVAAGARRRTKSVIVDRCNLTANERREWLNCMHNPPKGEAALVYFAAPTDVCVDRVQGRTDHPTIRHGKRAMIVPQLAAKLEPPTDLETRTVFGTVETVKSFDESDALLRKWGVNQL